MEGDPTLTYLFVLCKEQVFESPLSTTHNISSSFLFSRRKTRSVSFILERSVPPRPHFRTSKVVRFDSYSFPVIFILLVVQVSVSSYLRSPLQLIIQSHPTQSAVPTTDVHFDLPK